MNVVAIRPEYGIVPDQLTTEFDKLPQAKRRLARTREQFIQPVLTDIQRGVSQRAAIENLLMSIKCQAASDELLKLADDLGSKGKPPSHPTVARWVKAYSEEGVNGLVSAHKGRQRKLGNWEPRALYWYQQPQKLAISTVAELLQQEGFSDATYSRVSRFIKSLPHDVREKRRMGSKLYRDTQTPSRVRDTECIPVGGIYQGDGHTIDAYLAHPLTGNPWRPELTVWIDVRSRYIVGWYMSVAESSYSTLFSLSHALISHDHVPAALHIDNGSGFRSKMMHDESTGFYSRFDLNVMFSIPGNPQGKGQVERWFRTLRDKFDKTFYSYCGHDMAPDAIKKVLADAKAGKKPLPSLQTYMDGLKEFINFYNNRPHSALKGDTPANLWQQLERVPVHMTSAAIVRPRIERTIRRGSITLFNREYRHAELIRFNTDQVLVEYDLHNDSMVRVLTKDERLICDADLTQRTAYVSESRMEDMQQNRLKGQIKRLEKHADEKRAQAKLLVDHEAISHELDSDELPAGLEQHESEPLFNTYNTMEEPDSVDTDDCSIDIFDTSYD